MGLMMILFMLQEAKGSVKVIDTSGGYGGGFGPQFFLQSNIFMVGVPTLHAPPIFKYGLCIFKFILNKNDSKFKRYGCISTCMIFKPLSANESA